MFVSMHEFVQLTTMSYRTRLEGSWLLSDIIMLCSNLSHNISLEYTALPGIPQNPYSSLCQIHLSKNEACRWKLKIRTSEDEIRKISSQRCCKNRWCQTFPWESRKNVWRKFYSCLFDIKWEIAFVVQGLLNYCSPGQRKFNTLKVNVRKNAWYIF